MTLWQKLWDATLGRPIARRILAMVFVPSWLVMHLVWASFGLLIGLGVPGDWKAGAEIIQAAAAELNRGSLIILLFYFGGDALAKNVVAMKGNGGK